jgi:flagellar protein FlaG
MDNIPKLVIVSQKTSIYSKPNLQSYLSITLLLTKTHLIYSIDKKVHRDADINNNNAWEVILMMEPVSNQVVLKATKVLPVDKVNPIQKDQDQDIFKNQEQLNNQEYKDVPKEKMEEVVKGINDFIQPVNTSLKFVLHEKLNDYYVTVVDNETKEVIKEISSKKLMDTYADMMEFVGLLVDKKI